MSSGPPAQVWRLGLQAVFEELVPVSTSKVGPGQSQGERPSAHCPWLPGQGGLSVTTEVGEAADDGAGAGLPHEGRRRD